MRSKGGFARYTGLCRRDFGGLDVRDSEVGQRIRNELEETRRRFHALLGSLSAADWDAPSHNPAWTNGQLVFHMLFAFMSDSLALLADPVLVPPSGSLLPRVR